MEYISILAICIVSIAILKFAFNVELKDIKKIKELGYDKNLNELTNVLPENKIVCEKMLQKLGNSSVKIEETENSDKTLTYYSVMTNHIIIANIKDTFTRIQTIAHECLHSMQKQSILKFNFVFSNIYLLYFVVISILTICKIVHYPMIQIGILLLLGSIYYSIRSYLETDAMTKAPYLAKEYMEEEGTLAKEDIDKIIENCNVLNSIGIPMTSFMLMVKVINKVMIYCVIAIFI